MPNEFPSFVRYKDVNQLINKYNGKKENRK